MIPRRREPDHFRDDREDENGVCKPSCDERRPETLGRPFTQPEYPDSWCTPHGGGPDIELYDLIDYTLQVGNTGIKFVAGLTGWRESDGTARFIPGACDAAFRRAASTLAWMALVSGQTFQFLRFSLHLSIAQTAALVGETESTVEDWEDGSLPVAVSPWQCLADAALKADGRAGIAYTPLPAPDFRPRMIRIWPDIPYPVIIPPPPPPPCPC